MNNKLIIPSDGFKEVCSKILYAMDNPKLSIVTETLSIKAQGGTLTLSVTNREYFVKINLDVDNEVNFNATVNAMLFLKLVAQITTETIELEVVDNALNITGNGHYNIPLIYDGEELLELPEIEINNVVEKFTMASLALKSIVSYNSKEHTKGVISRPIQKMYYLDEKGCLTFTNGACVNEFELNRPIKILLNDRLVKLFKLFGLGDVEFTLGEDAISEDVVQTKVKFESDNIVITSIVNSDDNMLNAFPVSAIRERANKEYPLSININRGNMIQAINRISLFNDRGTIAKPYGVFVFGKEGVTIYDLNKKNSEHIHYTNTVLDNEYEAMLNLDDVKTTLEAYGAEIVNIHFGDESAFVFSAGVKNVLPEVRLA